MVLYTYIQLSWSILIYNCHGLYLYTTVMVYTYIIYTITILVQVNLSLNVEQYE